MSFRCEHIVVWEDCSFSHEFGIEECHEIRCALCDMPVSEKNINDIAGQIGIIEDDEGILWQLLDNEESGEMSMIEDRAGNEAPGKIYEMYVVELLEEISKLKKEGAK